MSAFRRRTVFATPLIAIISCGGSRSRPEEPTIPGEHWNVTANGGECHAHDIEHCPKGALCNPPPPRQIECPAGIADAGWVQVVEKPDHTCAVVPSGCIELACATQTTACPLPRDAPRKLHGPIWKVGRHQDRCLAVPECTTEPCDAKPRAIECPASLGVPPAEVRIGQLPSGACGAVPEGCLDETCAGEQMTCPMPAGKDLPPLVWDIARAGNECTATSRGPIAGEHTFKLACPPLTTSPPRYQIRRTNVTAPCELFVGAGPGVPTMCPEE